MGKNDERREEKMSKRKEGKLGELDGKRGEVEERKEGKRKEQKVRA